jgi:hypothetical protein
MIKRNQDKGIRNQDLTSDDLKSIAQFFKVIKYYLQLNRL